MYSYGPPHMAEQKQDDQLEHTYSSYVRIRDVALKTCQRRWMIGRSGERGSGISVLAARHDDDDDPGVQKIYVSNYKRIYTRQITFSNVSVAWSLLKRSTLYEPCFTIGQLPSPHPTSIHFSVHFVSSPVPLYCFRIVLSGVAIFLLIRGGWMTKQIHESILSFFIRDF